MNFLCIRLAPCANNPPPVGRKAPGYRSSANEVSDVGDGRGRHAGRSRQHRVAGYCSRRFRRRRGRHRSLPCHGAVVRRDRPDMAPTAPAASVPVYDCNRRRAGLRTGHRAQPVSKAHQGRSGVPICRRLGPGRPLCDGHRGPLAERRGLFPHRIRRRGRGAAAVVLENEREGAPCEAPSRRPRLTRRAAAVRRGG